MNQVITEISVTAEDYPQAVRKHRTGCGVGSQGGPVTEKNLLDGMGMWVKSEDKFRFIIGRSRVVDKRHVTRDLHYAAESCRQNMIRVSPSAEKVQHFVGFLYEVIVVLTDTTETE